MSLFLCGGGGGSVLTKAVISRFNAIAFYCDIAGENYSWACNIVMWIIGH